jgi:hypothetical protein
MQILKHHGHVSNLPFLRYRLNVIFEGNSVVGACLIWLYDVNSLLITKAAQELDRRKACKQNLDLSQPQTFMQILKHHGHVSCHFRRQFSRRCLPNMVI